MRNLITIILLLFVGFVNAQSFEFSCCSGELIIPDGTTYTFENGFTVPLTGMFIDTGTTGFVDDSEFYRNGDVLPIGEYTVRPLALVEGNPDGFTDRTYIIEFCDDYNVTVLEFIN